MAKIALESGIGALIAGPKLEILSKIPGKCLVLYIPGVISGQRGQSERSNFE